MDGNNRRVLASINLMWPNGLTLDYATRCATFFLDLSTVKQNQLEAI